MSAGEDGTARTWKVDGTGAAVVFRGDAHLYSAAFSPDMQTERIVVAGAKGTVRIVTTNGSGEPIVLRGHNGNVYSAAFNFDGTRLITGGEDATARVWRLDEHADPLVLRGHGEIMSVAFGPEPRAALDRSAERLTAGGILPADVITTGGLGSACFWPLDRSDPIVLRHASDRSTVNAAAFSPDGTRVVTGGDDGTARVWRIH